MARYAVTGASGFIGANLVARLKAQDHWVRAVDVKDTPERAHLYEPADELMTADLRMPRIANFATVGVDRVFHLGADHGGAGYFYGPDDFKAANNNLTIDRNVLSTAMANGVERLFFASSACTYPVSIQGKGARALKESDWGGGPVERLYGEAKRMSTLLMEGSRQHGFDARSGIFHTIYGPGQDTEEPRAKFPTAICRKVLDAWTLGLPTDHSQPILTEPIEVWGDGTQIRTFLYIEDALDRIQAVMEENYSGPVNIGSDEEVTVRQCADWVCEAAGVEPNYDFQLDKPVGVAARSSDNTLFYERYGKTEQTPAKVGFQRLYEWLSEQRVQVAA